MRRLFFSGYRFDGRWQRVGSPQAGACATGRGGACAAGSGSVLVPLAVAGLQPQAAARCLCHKPWRGFSRRQRQLLSRWRGARCIFRSPWHRQVPLPRCGDRAEGARPRPLHSPALRQPRSPLRGAFTPSAFLTDRRRFAPAQRRLSRHPCRSPWKASLVQRVGMALPNLAVGLYIFRSRRAAGRFLRCIRTARR